MSRWRGYIRASNDSARGKEENLIMFVVECPMCSESIVLPDNIEFGDLVDCEECDREFEVVSVQPLELEWVDDEEEDGFETDEDFY